VEDGRAVLDTASLGRIQVPVSGDFASKGARVVVAMRPEKLSLSRERGPEGGNAVQGIVKTTAYLGDRSHFYVHVDGTDKPFAVAAQEAGTSLTQSPDTGTAVWLTWPDEAPIVLPRP
jgi:ABC-type Fe3+/spermidine/putrescine transport system ATPase subunit